IWGAGGLGGGIWSPAQGGVGMGIWSSGSDTLFRVSEDGRGDVNLGIWGTNGTSIPQVEMKATATGGRFALGAAGGQLMPQLEATSGDNSGSLGIWGTNGTAMPVINMEATDTAGAIGLYFGVRAGDYPQVDIQGSPSRGSLKMWGDLHTRSNQPGVEFTSDSAGGLLFVRGSDDNARMMVYGEGYGDNAVFMSDNAVSSREILDEPGIAQSKGVSCNDVTSTSTMEDIQTISITIPSDGYIFLLGHAEAEFNGTTSGNRVDVQLDETSGGSPVNGNFVRIGLTAYSGTSYMDFDVSLQRTYFKSAGTYTFRMEARHLGSGDASLCFPIITAMYFPSSYGTVTTVAGNPEDNPDYRTVSSSGLGGDGTSETVYEVDLRHLELRAREARERALEAELDLQRARSAQDGMN
ncbi:MAG: hypothetical protein OEV80_16870, partial [candidate division Zixibacteria bacterium]|nr:hypothetical protein [candidate division Zixibacteria bacterium]